MALSCFNRGLSFSMRQILVTTRFPRASPVALQNVLRLDSKCFASSAGPMSVGEQIMARVLSFGPLGASVVVENDQTSEGEDSLLPQEGLITQFEIGLFREARGTDVVIGDLLPAYVNNVREDGKVDVGLRPPVGDRITVAKEAVLAALEASGEEGSIPIGDKSEPALIRQWLPGVSKKQFKDAVGGLRREGVVRPSPHQLELVPVEERAALATAAAAAAGGRGASSRAGAAGGGTARRERAGGAAGLVAACAHRLNFLRSSGDSMSGERPPWMQKIRCSMTAASGSALKRSWKDFHSLIE